MYNPKHQGYSAGVYVRHQKPLDELSPAMVQLMNGFGFDMSKAIATPISPKLVQDKDLLIMMTDWQSWPEYVHDYSRKRMLIQWDIPDPRYGTNEDMHKTIEVVREHVQSLDEVLH
jgi:protein-tyrosine-phosphatase